MLPLAPDLLTSHRISQQSAEDDGSAQQKTTSTVGMCEIVCHQRAFEILMTHGGWEMTANEDKVGVATRIWCEDLIMWTLLLSGAYTMTLCYD